MNVKQLIGEFIELTSKGEDILWIINSLMTVQDIMDLGFSKWTAYNILRQAKHIMVERGFDFYNNKGLELFPYQL